MRRINWDAVWRGTFFGMTIVLLIGMILGFILLAYDLDTHSTLIDKYSQEEVECTGFFVDVCYDTTNYYQVDLVDGLFGKYINKHEVSYEEYYDIGANYDEYLK